MPSSVPVAPLELLGCVTLLGEGGDVELLDGRGVDADLVQGRIDRALAGGPVGVRLDEADLVPVAVAGGACLIHLPAAMGAVPEVREAAGTGVVLVFAGDHDTARLAALDVLADGGHPGRLVMEVPVSLDLVPPSTGQVREADRAGLAMGVHLIGRPEPDEEMLGWEIAMTTHVLAIGVRCVREVPVARFRRVAAVIDSLRAAAIDGGAV